MRTAIKDIVVDLIRDNEARHEAFRAMRAKNQVLEARIADLEQKLIDLAGYPNSRLARLEARVEEAARALAWNNVRVRP